MVSFEGWRIASILPFLKTDMATFTPHQDAALKAVADWLKAKPGRNGTPPVFRLFGFAGTGKTTLARHIAEGVDGEVKFAAFTGKAALVMRNKGCDEASTIHSLIYRARESGEEQPSFELWDDAPASKEVWGHLFGTINTREKFVDHRKELALHEWARFKANDSLECRNCHSTESMDITKQSPRASVAHQRFLFTGEKTCIDCHKGIAHQLPDMRGVPGWQ